MTPELIDAADRETLTFKLPQGLILAIIKVESNGNTWAWKVEPPYRYLVNARTKKPFRKLTSAENQSERAPRDFPRCVGVLESLDTEWWGQQASWGAMQVMGAVAREYGFNRHFPALCDPNVGVYWGARHLKHLMRFEKKYGIDGVIAAYNAGSPRLDDKGELFVNQAYVDKVLSYSRINHS